MRNDDDFRRLRGACDIMAKLRCSGAHINLASLEGGFGESAWGREMKCIAFVNELNYNRMMLLLIL